MKANQHKAKVEHIKSMYPVGCRIELIYMNDPYTTLVPGIMGTVTRVDDYGDLEVDWDDGSRLKVILHEDQIRRLEL